MGRKKNLSKLITEIKNFEKKRKKKNNSNKMKEWF